MSTAQAEKHAANFGYLEEELEKIGQQGFMEDFISSVRELAVLADNLKMWVTVSISTADDSRHLGFIARRLEKIVRDQAEAVGNSYLAAERVNALAAQLHHCTELIH